MYKLFDTIQKIGEDFRHRRPPFNDTRFPEERLLDKLPHASNENREHHRMRLVSAFATFDYNRNANRLVDNMLELHRKNPAMLYQPHLDTGDMGAMLANIGFRFPVKDAFGWKFNCRKVHDKYSDDWMALLSECNEDAERFVELLRRENFMYLKGEKIAPMYARIISDEVVMLENLWKLDIPVDTHIRKLSWQLFGNHFLNDDDIRTEWRRLGAEGLERHVLDGALWLIGNNWNEWGADYWHAVLS